MNDKKFKNIGAFININNIEFLIGFILFEICNEEKFIHNVKNLIKKKCCIYYLINCNNNKYGYIHTIGVINEYRKLYIGTELINLFIKECKNLKCIACYLHCIEYNKSAQKFYEKNNWIKNRIKKDHYCLDEKFYDSYVYYIILNKNYIEN
jgi:ribosomal protein S18 acetylase RimI-like enzyme